MDLTLIQIICHHGEETWGRKQQHELVTIISVLNLKFKVASLVEMDTLHGNIMSEVSVYIIVLENVQL